MEATHQTNSKTWVMFGQQSTGGVQAPNHGCCALTVAVLGVWVCTGRRVLTVRFTEREPFGARQVCVQLLLMRLGACGKQGRVRNKRTSTTLWVAYTMVVRLLCVADGILRSHRVDLLGALHRQGVDRGLSSVVLLGGRQVGPNSFSWHPRSVWGAGRSEEHSAAACVAYAMVVRLLCWEKLRSTLRACWAYSTPGVDSNVATL